MKKIKQKKNKNFNPNQTSFYFEDYLETNQKNKKNNNSNISQDRVYLLFFLFFSLIVIFSIKITLVSLKDPKILFSEEDSQYFTPLRRDIVDRNGILISRNIKSFHAAIKPNLIKNKENFILKLRLNFPDLNIDEIKNNLNHDKYFYLKKDLIRTIKRNCGLLGKKE